MPEWFTGRTERGFKQHRIEDSYGKTLWLRESSSVEPHIWLFPEITTLIDGSVVCGTHLTPEMARDVATRLLAWADEQERD